MDVFAYIAVIDDDLSPDVKEASVQIYVFPVEGTGFLGTQYGVQHESDAHADGFPAQAGFDDFDLLRGIDRHFLDLVGLADTDILGGILLDVV